MRKRRMLDLGRRLLLAALFVSALLLLRQTGYYAGIRSRLERSRSERADRGVTAQAELPRSVEAVTPLAITVCGTESGGRYGTAYEAETAAVFRRFSVDLGEALGSAGTPAECAEEGFRACLDRCSVAMQFAFPIRLELLSGWLGVEMSSTAAEHAARLLCLSASESDALLCYRTEDGTCYACSTAVSAEGFRSRAAEYAPNGAIYEYESERLKADGYSLLLPAPPTAAVLKSAVPLLRETETDSVMTAMGMNSFLSSSYTESDGTVVFVNDETTLRISPNGVVFFRRTGLPDSAAEDTVTAAASRAWSTAELCAGPHAGDGALRLTGVEYNASQHSHTVLLDYVVEGIPVRLASGHAAELVVRAGKVIQAQLQLRQFTAAAERTEMLPCLQAAAIAADAQGRPGLIYADAGDATECMWVVMDG